MEIICSFCKSRFDDINTLQNHTLQNHQQQQQQQIFKLEEEENDAISLNNKVPILFRLIVIIAICRSTDVVGPFLVCQQCDKTLHGFTEFGYHMRTHLISEDREQKCNLCKATFTDPIARISHIVEHFMINSVHVQCGECPTVSFYNFQQIRQHHSDAHLEILYRCAICHQIFNSQYRFQKHSAVHVKEVLRYYCSACSIPFETRDLLAIHVQLFHDRPAVTLMINNLQRNSSENGFCKQQLQSENRLMKCLVCDMKFENEDELDFHRLIAHCKVPRSNRCADCQTQIQTVTHFKEHIREHMQDEGTVSCIICRQALRNDAQIDAHAQYHLQFSDDALKSNRECSICQQHFSRESLGLHMVEHSNNGDCPYCDGHFPNIESLLAHIDSTHSSVEAAYQCHNCRQTFHFKSQLQNHDCSTVAHGTLLNSFRERISPILNQQQIYQCKYCPKMFGSESALQGHSQVHSTRAFRCDLCVLSFSSNQRLETHRKKHFAEKNFTCQICDLQFLNHDDLSLHVKMHGGTFTRYITEPAMKTCFR
ncbi:zinc finger, C2H2 type [Onchocerca flexuosa]|uniref:Zinc finger, C2H2 type n=1 Tax=Onchocerca flexuosa TaxID=387005 RepID=A0A238C6L6_9BILA|nr:zinc finger, C2H2 type [Onchocerca flexuosa]